MNQLNKNKKKSSFPLFNEQKLKQLKKNYNNSGYNIKEDEGQSEVRSGWSSRRDSQISVEDIDLIPKLNAELKEFIG